MKRQLNILTFLFIVFSITSLFAQQVNLYGSLALPIGDFGKNLGRTPLVTQKDGFDVGNRAGFAVEGFGIGAEIALPTGFQGLSWISGLTFIMNGTDVSELKKTFNELLGDPEEVEFDYSSWIQIPVMTGFKYDLTVMKNFDFYAMAQGGINFIKPATRKAIVEGVTVDERKYELGRQFGYGLGGGLVILKRYDIGVRYLNFSEALFDGTRKLDLEYFDDAYDKIGKDLILGEKRPVATLLIVLGFHL